MPQIGMEPETPVFEREKTLRVFDYATSVMDKTVILKLKFVKSCVPTDLQFGP